MSQRDQANQSRTATNGQNVQLSFRSLSSLSSC
jgi:hypothetical protein